MTDTDIELVIKIPEYIYQDILMGHVVLFNLENAVVNGTPLPKGHGRLIDADALINSTDKEYVHKYEIALAPTIIEADKGDN